VGLAGGVRAPDEDGALNPTAFLKKLLRYRPLIEAMVRRDLSQRYAGSLLGLGWTILFPLAQFGLYYLLFNVILRVQPGQAYQGISFAFWLLPGMLPWFLVGEVLQRSTGLLVDRAGLITKNVFPSELLSVISVAVALIHHLVALGLILVLQWVFKLPVTASLFLLPLYLALGTLMCLGISWLLSALTVFLRDLGQFVGLVVMAWSICTPIMYPVDRVPSGMAWAFKLNPLYHLVQGYRVALLSRVPVSLPGAAFLAFFSLAILLTGGLVFRRLKPAFPDVL
jgi:ABC-type polysaccharide/polyol phosphate export permease